MSNYKIIAFQNNQQRKFIWTGTNEGLFKCEELNEIYHLFYLLSKPQSFNIYKIKRLTDNLEFSITDRIFNIGDNNIITSLKIGPDNQIYFNNQYTYNINQVARYVAPQPVQPPQPVVTPNFWSNLETLVISKYPRPIRIQGLLKKHQGHTGRKETPLQFLVKFFKEWNEENNTIYVDNSEVQTATGKRRSLGDIFMIMKYYYPTITLKEVFKLLHTDINTVITSGFRTSKCNTIHKRVWYYSEGGLTSVMDENSNDEYGNRYQKYVDNL